MRALVALCALALAVELCAADAAAPAPASTAAAPIEAKPAAAAAGSLRNDADQFEIQLPAEWQTVAMTPPLRARLQVDHLAQSAQADAFIGVRVRPGNANGLAEADFIGLLIRLRKELGVEPFTYDKPTAHEVGGMPGWQAVCSVGAGDERLAMTIRATSAFKRVYQVHAIKEGGDVAADKALIAALEGFRFTADPKPAPVVAAPPAEDAKAGGNGLVIGACVVGGIILVALAFVFGRRGRGRPQRRGARIGSATQRIGTTTTQRSARASGAARPRPPSRPPPSRVPTEPSVEQAPPKPTTARQAVARPATSSQRPKPPRR